MITSTQILYTDCVQPHENLAVEESLLYAVRPGEATLFLWQNRHTVVIGAGQNAWRECRTALLQAEGGTLARRSTGGGAVYHDLGNLNFSFLVPREDYDVARQLRVVQSAVRALGIDAQPSGRNDVLAQGRKFSGNAFRLLPQGALHHGTLLVSVDMARLGRYLNPDPSKLQAKGVKSVPARVVNLNELADIDVPAARAAMMEAFCAEYGFARPVPVEQMNLPGLTERRARYASWEWNYGASPSGDLTLERRFEWGGVTLHAGVQSGRLNDVRAYTDAMDETLAPRLSAALEGCELDRRALCARVEALDAPGLCEWLAQADI